VYTNPFKLGFEYAQNLIDSKAIADEPKAHIVVTDRWR
tara:strand:- start:201 stop:314 length:114 start_codon:yes stop_codon:yes gene_type:complete